MKSAIMVAVVIVLGLMMVGTGMGKYVQVKVNFDNGTNITPSNVYIETNSTFFKNTTYKNNGVEYSNYVYNDGKSGNVFPEQWSFRNKDGKHIGVHIKLNYNNTNKIRISFEENLNVKAYFGNPQFGAFTINNNVFKYNQSSNKQLFGMGSFVSAKYNGIFKNNRYTFNSLIDYGFMITYIDKGGEIEETYISHKIFYKNNTQNPMFYHWVVGRIYTKLNFSLEKVKSNIDYKDYLIVTISNGSYINYILYFAENNTRIFKINMPMSGRVIIPVGAMKHNINFANDDFVIQGGVGTFPAYLKLKNYTMDISNLTIPTYEKNKSTTNSNPKSASPIIATFQSYWIYMVGAIVIVSGTTIFYLYKKMKTYEHLLQKQ